jgi:hypothetical protein
MRSARATQQLFEIFEVAKVYFAGWGHARLCEDQVAFGGHRQRNEGSTNEVLGQNRNLSRGRLAHPDDDRLDP